MKILWVNPTFLHPTTKGGQIRTLEIVKRLHRRHEIHYVAFDRPDAPDGPLRAHEYSTKWYPVKHPVPDKQSFAFALQVAANVFSPLPLAVSRWRSREMANIIDRLRASERFDSVVCDFLFPAPNFRHLTDCVLFQHNVETMIWRRHADTAPDIARRVLFRRQAGRMFRYEGKVCRQVRHVIAVSDIDARRMEDLFGIRGVSATPTGVDTEYFAPPKNLAKTTDIVFIGSMDWMPNIDGVLWFAEQILPRIRERRPDVTVAIVGRSPTSAILDLSRQNSKIIVTGTVDDIRPYLWQSKICIVPLRIGGGTRLKIFEAMAAKVPVVSTAIGAEGLDVEHQRDLLIADEPDAFADACVKLLESSEARDRFADAAWRLVASRFSWERVTEEFEEILRAHRVQ